jgi:hypothetical protein
MTILEHLLIADPVTVTRNRIEVENWNCDHYLDISGARVLQVRLAVNFSWCVNK